MPCTFLSLHYDANILYVCVEGRLVRTGGKIRPGPKSVILLINFSQSVSQSGLLSCVQHVTNEKVGNRIRQAIGPYEDLLTTVKKRKLRWYGHKTRSTGLAKMILQGTVQGGRRRGRQKKRWEDNITEWTGLKLGEALRKAENREEWRTVVARSSLVPQRSNRLWDK